MEDQADSTNAAATSPPSFIVFGRRYDATMSTVEAAEPLGCSVERLQQQRGKGTLPVEPLQLGRRLRRPTLLVAQVLGVDFDERRGQATTGNGATPRNGKRDQLDRYRPACRLGRPGAA